MTTIRLTRIVTVVLLAGIAVHRYVTIRKPVGTAEYHERVRAAAALVPKRIGGWIGTDVPIPPRAIKVLDPNAMISRQYVNVETGVSANISFVHCSDAHDMVGHFPLRCYPAQGWNVQDTEVRDWVVGDLKLTGMEYKFWISHNDNSREDRTQVVANCLFRPGGRVIRDMSALSKSIIGAGGQAAGAGQLQIRFDASVPREQRDAAIAELVAGYAPAIQAILADGPK